MDAAMKLVEKIYTSTLHAKTLIDAGGSSPATDGPSDPDRHCVRWSAAFLVFPPMKAPHDRHKFVSKREERFQIQNSGAQQPATDLASVVQTPEISPGEDQTADPKATKLKLPAPAEQPVEPAAKESAPPVKLPRAFRPLNPGNLEGENRRNFSSCAMVWFSIGCLALGAFGGYLLPRSSKIPIPAGVVSGFNEGADSLTPTDEHNLDAAYAARHANKFAEAEQRFTALARLHPTWSSMQVEIGRTLFYEKNANAARVQLKAAANRGSTPAEANFILGLLAVTRKSYREAEASFASAVAFDPTQPNYYYFWGECLRDEGKPAEAAIKFRSAMLRNQYETNTGLYRLKFWLSKIEAGQADDENINAEIEAALAQPRPPMEALFAAAARELKAGEIKAAASQMLRARQLVEPDIFFVIMRDPFFTPESSRPELAELFRAASAIPGPKLDEATRGQPSGSVARASPSPASNK